MNNCKKYSTPLLVLFLSSLGPSFCRAQSSCGLDARNLHNVAMPSIREGAMSPRLAAEVKRGFDLLALQRQGESGVAILRSVIADAKRDSNLCAEGLAEFGIGEVESSAHLNEALPHFTRSEAGLQHVGTPLALALVHERIAMVQHLLGQNDVFLKAAPGIEQEFREAGDPASAIKLQSTALQYKEGAQDPDAQLALLHALDEVKTENVTGVRGYVEWATGSAMRRTGRYGEILGHFNAALTAFTACSCQGQTKAAVLLNLAAASDSAGDAESVMQYAKQADAIYREEHAETMRPQSMRLIAAAYAHQKDWPKAIAEYQAALALAEREHAEFALPNLLIEMAAAQGDSGHPQDGLLTLARPMPKPTPSQNCSLIAQRSILSEQADLRTQALDDGKKTLAECRQIMVPSSFAWVQLHMAKAQLRSGQTDDGLASARTAVAIIETQRPRVRPSDAALVEFNEHQTSAYSVLIGALLQAKKPEEALLASEQLRGRAFIDLAGTTPGGGPPGTPSGRPGPSSGRPAPGLRSETRPFTLTMEEIRKTVDRQHATLVSYWVDEKVVHAWVVAPGKPLVQKDLSVTNVQLAELVRETLPGASSTVTRGGPQVRTRGGEAQRIAPATRKPWRDLYKLLIEPLAGDLPTEDGSLVTIVPQGPLFQLAFPALLNADNRYLIEKYAMNTAPSVGVLQVAEKNAVSAAALPAHYLVVANPDQFPSVNGVPLPSLPGTDAEAKSIGKHLGDKVTLLEGRNASLLSLNEALPGNTVVHFATHAIVSDMEPSTSFLALDTHQGNGKLTERTVYGMHLKASLVVLSACRTGRGKITGDGVMGMSRAFLYAGAASVVTTLWDVVDSPTARLMSDFYRSLAEGTQHSEALRQAQLSLIRDLRSRKVRVPTLAGPSASLPENPIYWAGFSLSGQP